jgi:hypothetical protein
MRRNAACRQGAPGDSAVLRLVRFDIPQSQLSEVLRDSVRVTISAQYLTTFMNRTSSFRVLAFRN